MIPFTGSCAYQTAVESAVGELTVAVPCQIGLLHIELRCFVDTGARRPLLPADIAVRAGVNTEGPGLGRAIIDTRLGRFDGHYERAALTLRGAQDEDLTIDMTWLILPDWPGPVVLGWVGCLDRFCWAIDPAAERFHFTTMDYESD